MNEKEAIIKRMLADGLPYQTIAKYTNLDIKEVEAIADGKVLA